MNYWLSFPFKEIHIQDVLLWNWQKWEICQINIKANIFHVFKCEDLRHDDNTFTLLPSKLGRKLNGPTSFSWEFYRMINQKEHSQLFTTILEWCRATYFTTFHKQIARYTYDYSFLRIKFYITVYIHYTRILCGCDFQILMHSKTANIPLKTLNENEE